MTPETMTLDGLISVQAMTARIACRWMCTRQLEGMSERGWRGARDGTSPPGLARHVAPSRASVAGASGSDPGRSVLSAALTG